MATVDVCNGDFHAKHDEEVNFTNPTGKDCQLTAAGSGPWPFTDGPPIDVPVSGSKTKIKSKDDLPDGTYLYDSSCVCAIQTQKSVTVP